MIFKKGINDKLKDVLEFMEQVTVYISGQIDFY